MIHLLKLKLLLFCIFAVILSVVPGISVSAQDIYWENPEILIDSNVWFPLTASSSNLSVVMWQEFDKGAVNSETFSISLIAMTGSQTRIRYDKVLGPFPFSGDRVSVSSLAVDQQGIIYIALSNSDEGIIIYSSDNNGESFKLLGTPGMKGVLTVSPKLFVTDEGSLILFVTQPLDDNRLSVNKEGTLGITYSVSLNGRSWSDYLPLVSSGELSNVYLPYHISSGGLEHVIFQASPGDSRFYHLYYISSRDGGRTWTVPVWITDISESGNKSVDFDNQRGFLNKTRGNIYLLWERKLGSSSPLSYYGELNISSGKLTSVEKISGTGISITPVNNPQLYILKGQPVALWYNNIGQVVLAGRENNQWINIDIPGQTGGGLSNFCRFLTISNEMHIIWQSDIGGNSGLTSLSPDKTVPEIIVSPVNFRSDALSQDTYTVTWNLPSDSSGIAGFSYSFDRNEKGTTPGTIMIRRRDDRRASFTALEDGEWFIHVRAVDYAHNWSDPSTVKFIRDTTAPGRVSFSDIETDEDGTILSNTGLVNWNAPSGEEAVGYSYKIQYLADSDYSGDFSEFNIQGTPNRYSTSETSYRFYNQDNGLWSFTVSAFDVVGNKGEPATFFLSMNKYIQVTYITDLSAVQDDLGAITIRILGRGFSVGGRINTIILDRDKKEPFDYVYIPDSGYFRVVSDRIIGGLKISEMTEGAYHIGLIHPSRGLSFSEEQLEFESTGTVKFGNFSILDDGKDSDFIFKKLLTLSLNKIFFGFVVMLMIIMVIFSFIRIIALVRESRIIKMEVRALVNNKVLPSELRMERIRNMQKRGMGLRIKFALLVTSLVLLVVLMVSYSLSLFMISTQQKNLTDGLFQTTEVLINSVNTAAGKYLQENNTLELKRLPSLIESMSSARFLTITGPGTASVEDNGVEFLWATNDGNIRDKVNLSVFETEDDILDGLPGGIRFSEGSLTLDDNLTEVISELADKINSKGAESVGGLSNELTRLQEIASGLSRKARTEADIDEIRKMQDEISMISGEIEIKLAEIGNYFGSVPEFDPEKIEREYTFYRPIVYQHRGNNDKFYQGTVRLKISTDEIINEIKTSTSALVRRTVIIALIAIGLGIVGALVLASIIISPINHLLKKVEEIRDSVNHLELKNFSVNVKTRDEISSLAGAVNQMSKGLYKAALANQELTVGKDVQKQFLPLEKNTKGEKTSLARKDTDYIEFFGYYEGAKGVSGDYFDFLEIDKDRFAIIKCDISGKGVSASLIMAAVATIFHSYFNDWKRDNERRKNIATQKRIKIKPDIPKIDQLVYSINELVESMSFKGRFAAFIIVYIDTVTGQTRFCNAGDNLVHIYKQSKRSMEILTIPEAPAAGVFPNDMVEMTAGFQVVPHQMDHGDVLFLFTDGIEEAQRHFRNSRSEVVECQDEGHDKNNKEIVFTHSYGENFEEFGIQRMHAIIQSVINRDKYELYKYHNEYAEEKFSFDFGNCEGTFSEAIFALLAVERIYRLYPNPTAGAGDRISVDEKIMEFMEEHFVQFDRYFNNSIEKGVDNDYITFTHTKEDEQFDDLTILGIRRK